MQRLTFIIPSYNYAQYIRRAIDSALGVAWPDLEVIVVDDGSTDDSVRVIRSFGNNVRLIQQPNAGPRVACNVGFAVSTGDWVVFLDADDCVSPDLARAIQAHEREGISKIQFQMQRITSTDELIGRPFPHFRTVPTPEQVRTWMRTTASYPTPPGSGNAYPRSFLERLFPLNDSCGDATDSACLAAAPFLGDVVTVAEPMMSYRIHGANRSYLLADVDRFAKQIERAVQRHAFAQRLDGKRDQIDWIAPIFRGRHLLQLRVAHRRLTTGAPPIPGDSYRRMLRDSLLSVSSPGPEGFFMRVLIATWSLCVLLLPRPLAIRVVQARFTQSH